MTHRRALRAIPTLLSVALLALAAAAPGPDVSGPAPPPQLQPPCDSYASAVTGDSSVQLAGGIGVEQALPEGMSVAACSLRTAAGYYSMPIVVLRAWDPTTLAPDPTTIALRTAFFDPSRILWANLTVPRATFVPPVVALSVAGVAEPPASRVAMQLSGGQSRATYAVELHGFFNPDGPSELPAAIKFSGDSVRVPLPGNHPVLAHAVCSGDTDLASLRIVQSVMRTDVTPFPAPREFLQRFRVPVQVELRWVELAFGELFVPYFESAGETDPMPPGPGPRATTLAIMDGNDLPVPVPDMPASMVEAPFDIFSAFGFGIANQHWMSHLDFDHTVTLEPGHDYWIWVRETAPVTWLNRRIRGNESAVFKAGVGPYFARPDSSGPWIQAADQVLAFRIVGRPMVPPPIPPTQVAAAFAMQATPNPAPGSVRVDWSGAVGPVRFDVFDARGRRVSQREGGAAGQWMWDGTDLDGRPVASGIYFVHARDSQGGRAVQRAVLVR